MLAPQDTLHMSAGQTSSASSLQPSLAPQSPQFMPGGIIDSSFPSNPRSPHITSLAYVPPPFSPTQQRSDIEIVTGSPQELPPVYTPAKQSFNAAAVGRSSSPRIIVSEHFLDEAASRRHSRQQRQQDRQSQQSQSQQRHVKPSVRSSNDKSAVTTITLQSKEIQYDYNHEYFRRRQWRNCLKCCVLIIILGGIITGVLFATVFKHSGNNSSSTTPSKDDLSGSHSSSIPPPTPTNKDDLCKNFGCSNQYNACRGACNTDTAYLVCLKPCNGDWSCSIDCQWANPCYKGCDNQMTSCQTMCQ